MTVKADRVYLSRLRSLPGLLMLLGTKRLENKSERNYSSTSRQIRSGIHRFAYSLLFLSRPEAHLLCSFHQTEPQTIVDLQAQHWNPLLDWVQSEFSVQISTSNSFFRPVHPEETFKKFDEVMQKFDPWEMAGTYNTVVRSTARKVG